MSRRKDRQRARAKLQEWFGEHGPSTLPPQRWTPYVEMMNGLNMLEWLASYFPPKGRST